MDFTETDKYAYYNLHLARQYIIPMFIRKVDIAERKLCLHPATNSVIGAGQKAVQAINNDLRDSGVLKATETLTSHLVPSGKGKWKHVLKLCVPNQIGWYDLSQSMEIQPGCFKADMSSAFPSQLQSTIPTLKGCRIKYDKKMEPTEEFPFVFTYTLGKTYGRVEIFNELDTDIDMDSTWMRMASQQMLGGKTRLDYLSGKCRDREIHLNPVYRNKIATEFICIACKTADISLADAIQGHYDKKVTALDMDKVNAEKMIMNALIGKFQANAVGTLPFISAVVIARQNHKMITICDELKRAGNIPLYIATDCVIWQGNPSDLATHKKALGAFVYEYEDCEAYIVQVGAYQVRKDGKVLTICQYLPNGEEKNSIPFGELPLPKSKSIII